MPTNPRHDEINDEVRRLGGALGLRPRPYDAESERPASQRVLQRTLANAPRPRRRFLVGALVAISMIGALAIGATVVRLSTDETSPTAQSAPSSEPSTSSVPTVLAPAPDVLAQLIDDSGVIVQVTVTTAGDQARVDEVFKGNAEPGAVLTISGAPPLSTGDYVLFLADGSHHVLAGFAHTNHPGVFTHSIDPSGEQAPGTITLDQLRSSR